MSVLASDISRVLDPALWLRGAGIDPDAWQERAMRSTSKRKLWNVHRQGGKSTTAAAKALDKAISEPGSLTVCVSPSQRQSSEWLRGVLKLYAQHKNLPPITNESAHRIEVASSRILSLPSSEGTFRGYSKVALLILDECSRIDDGIISACRPMIALGGEGGGDILALTTPAGPNGAFHEWWTNGGDTWEREQITVEQCPRIDPAFLADERKALGEMMFRQEYLCEFVDNDLQMFSSSIIDAAFSAEVQPLWA